MRSYENVIGAICVSALRGVRTCSDIRVYFIGHNIKDGKYFCLSPSLSFVKNNNFAEFDKLSAAWKLLLGCHTRCFEDFPHVVKDGNVFESQFIVCKK